MLDEKPFIDRNLPDVNPLTDEFLVLTFSSNFSVQIDEKVRRESLLDEELVLDPNSRLDG